MVCGRFIPLPTSLANANAIVVHYLPSADRIIALDNGKIVHQGTYEELAATGYDLTGALARAPTNQQASEGRTKMHEDEVESKTEKPNEKDAEEDDEMLQSYDKGGITAYKFYAGETGYFRIVTAGLFLVLYSAMRLGLQVNTWRHVFPPRAQPIAFFFSRDSSKNGRDLMDRISEAGWEAT